MKPGASPEVPRCSTGVQRSDDESRERPGNTSISDEPLNSRITSFEDSPPIWTRSLYDIYQSCTFALHVADPASFSEAAKSRDWQKAMDSEMEVIIFNNTWKLCELPIEKKAVGLKWIYKMKLNAHGRVIKLKARVVAKGYAQQQGIDYEEVFSPVARLETIRVLLALGAHSGWKVCHLNVKSAFLNGEIHEDVYVTQS